MLDQTETKPKGKAEKREKFVELAQSRTITAIKAIRVIGKLGNKSPTNIGGRRAEDRGGADQRDRRAQGADVALRREELRGFQPRIDMTCCKRRS